MKIVLLSMNFAPELTGIGKYSGEMAHALVERGHEVQVVCAVPFYPRWSVAEGFANRYSNERPRPGLTVRRCPIWLPKQLGARNRMLHLLSFALSSAPTMLALAFWRADVVIGVAPGIPSAPLAWITARLSGAKSWLHFQDLELEAAFELGLLRNRRLFALMRAAESRLVSGFDKVSTISGRMLQRLGAKGVDPGRAELLPNWVDIEVFDPRARHLEKRQELGIAADRLVGLFSGTINRKQGLEVLVEAARLLQASRPEVLLLICGNGELRAALEASAAGLDNVRFLDLQPAADFPRLMALADFHLLPQLRGAADLVMPSKLAAMLASGRPVIAAGDPGTELANVLGGVGLVTEPENAAGFAAAITRLAADPGLRERLGTASRRYAEEQLDARVVFERLDRQLRELAGETPALARQASGESGRG